MAQAARVSLPFAIPEPLAVYDIEALRSNPAGEHARILGEARAVFFERGQLPMTVMIYGRKIPPWIMGLEPPPTTDLLWGTVLLESNERTKVMFSRALPHLLSALGAVAVGIAFEGWNWQERTPEEKAAVRAWKAAHDFSMAGYPGIKEGIVVSFETKHAPPAAWFAHILRTNQGTALGCFEDAGSITGRFSNVLVDLDPPTHA